MQKSNKEETKEVQKESVAEQLTLANGEVQELS